MSLPLPLLLLLFAAVTDSAKWLQVASDSLGCLSASSDVSVGIVVSMTTAAAATEAACLSACLLESSNSFKCAGVEFSEIDGCRLFDVEGLAAGRGHSGRCDSVRTILMAEYQLQLVNCSQSTTHELHNCNQITDGDVKSISHSVTESLEWWQASLINRAFVTRIEFYNRPDEWKRRMNNFGIIVDGSVCANHTSEDGLFFVELNCNAIGSFVRLQSYRTDAHLNFAELIAYGIGV